MKMRNFYLNLALVLFLILPHTAFAFMDQYFEQFVVLSKHGEINGDSAGAQLGSALVSGDFNNDGLEDLAVSSPYESSKLKKHNGAVKIYFGNEESTPVMESDIVIVGSNSGDQIGTALTGGDFNDDGMMDLAISAPSASFGSTEKAGKVYVLFGRNDWDSQVIDLAYLKPNIIINGGESDEMMGLSIVGGDINNDGIDDLLVGAPNSDSINGADVGSVKVFLGDKAAFDNKPDLILYGEHSNERFGSALAIGNLNAQGENEIIVGSYFASEEQNVQVGRVYIYEGKTRLKSKIFAPDRVYSGNHPQEWFGFALATGDLNDDAIDDLAISSLPYAGDKQNNSLSIIYGDANFFSSSFDPEKEIVERLFDNQALMGSQILIEDLNGNGKNELIIGAPSVGVPTSSEAGDVYVLYDSLAKNPPAIIHGEYPDDWFGYSLSTLDFDGDGKKDLAISSQFSDTEIGANTGKVFLVLGSNDQVGSLKNMSMESNNVSRGYFASMVVDKFEIKTKKAEVLESCYDFREFCLFNFMAMSSYDEIILEPEMQLYPDILGDNPYYEDINIVTMMGLMNGFIAENDSPFRPERFVTRIQALKVVLTAADLIKPLYQFELVDDLGSKDAVADQVSYFEDINAKIAYMWWYPRYVNFAVENGIISGGGKYRPDEYITVEELEELIDKTLEHLSLHDEETQS